MDTDIQHIANSLNAKPRGKDNWMALCPSHTEKTPSLSLKAGLNGKPLVYCFGGCSQEEVLNALRGLGLWESATQQQDRCPYTSSQLEYYRHVAVIGKSDITHQRPISDKDKALFRQAQTALRLYGTAQDRKMLEGVKV